MRIEHIGLQVADPAAMADWYVAHLGFAIARGGDAPAPVRFITDPSGQGMIEIYRNPKVGVPDYAAADPLLFHLAFICDDIEATAHRLVAAGAKLVDPPFHTAAGDHLAMLRDPWNVPIQLCHRKEPMVGLGARSALRNGD